MNWGNTTKTKASSDTSCLCLMQTSHYKIHKLICSTCKAAAMEKHRLKPSQGIGGPLNLQA